MLEASLSIHKPRIRNKTATVLQVLPARHSRFCGFAFANFFVCDWGWVGKSLPGENTLLVSTPDYQKSV
jgi:hypothetical protein